jgi:D-inositol-3-phosphate glycosyltransferase
MLSMHTSPLADPGGGDAGGMNVYVRELSSSLAHAGVGVKVYVRSWKPGLPARVQVEPGFEVIHVPAGPYTLAKEDLVSVVDAFADQVATSLAGTDVSALHANYWLSVAAGHQIKHQLDVPLVATFHTLARVKADGGDLEPSHRTSTEAAAIGCCDLVCASNQIEADQLVSLYQADPARIELVPPGVDHALFSPGSRHGARSALGLDDAPTVLFVGRIQPLKGLAVAVEAVAQMSDHNTRLVVVGGPSGPDGRDEQVRAVQLVSDLGLAGRVTFVPPQPHHRLSTFYRAADVVVTPSRSESFGLVALEAAACGIPVVAAAVGGLTTIIQDGATGLLVDGRDPALFAAALDSVLSDPHHATSMGQAAAQVASGCTWSTSAARLRRLYSDLHTRVPVDCM